MELNKATRKLVSTGVQRRKRFLIGRLRKIILRHLSQGSKGVEEITDIMILSRDRHYDCVNEIPMELRQRDSGVVPET